MSVDRDIIETLQRQIIALEKRINELENNATPTVPIYDSGQFPIDAVEGQIAIAPVS